MPLRIATLAPTARQDTLTPQEWRHRIATYSNRVAAAVTRLDLDDLRDAFASLASWSDAQRAHQARMIAAERVLESDHRDDLAWLKLFAVAADELLKSLEEEPSEPMLLNTVGILLYELGEAGTAATLFKAALRLDPKLPHAKANLKQAQALARGKSAKLPAQLMSLVLPLVTRARRAAATASATDGLTVSLCMIVKDEEEMLPGCLEAVADGVDEIIVVDTGSSDRTVEIAEGFGAKVIHFPWNGSFADARNVGLDAATGDWLMYLDADEHLVPGDAAKIRGLLGRTWREGFHLVETNYTGGDESGTSVTHLALRIFRNRPEYRFEGKIHEQKTQNMPTYLPERFEATSIGIRHYGYLKSRISAKEKSRRNIELLEQERREAPSPFNSFNLGSEYLMLDEPGKAAEHFDDAWESLHASGEWTSAGYAPILASRIALARRESGRIADAREALAVAVAAMPDHTDLHFELALCARADGDAAEAERLARHCLSIGDAPAKYASVAGTGSYLALCLLGELAEERGDAAEAESHYLGSLADHPDYVAPVLPATTLLLRRGATEEELRSALPLDRPSASLLAATACLEQSSLGLAEELFQEVLAKQPGNDPARIGLAETLLATSRFADAAAVAADVPQDSPLAAAAAGEIAFAHAAAGDEASLRAALETVSLHPYDRALYEAWAAVLSGSQPAGSIPAPAFATAATALEALLRIQAFAAFEQLAGIADRIAVPADDRREVLARIYLRRGFLDSAADEWIALARERPSARAFVGLAQVAVARELPSDAVAFAEHALQLDPGSAEAGRLLDALRERVAA
ncbi:MAG TPA: glycosyltransferase [Gaiellaceae bacterium]|jgi:tetratricopeptide (TPR) repeat protein|nr:glycosyltransferase [Gaiellaceae bacterium]